jgi:hypothetical protein
MKYEKDKFDKIQSEICQLIEQIKFEIENNSLPLETVPDKIDFYEKKYDEYKEFLLDPTISVDLIRFQDEILNLKILLKKS